MRFIIVAQVSRFLNSGDVTTQAGKVFSIQFSSTSRITYVVLVRTNTINRCYPPKKVLSVPSTRNYCQYLLGTLFTLDFSNERKERRRNPLHFFP